MPQKILPNLYQVNVPLPRNPLRILNSYVIKGKDRNLVIDTGFNQPECEKSLKESLRELDVDMRDTDILLTHLHSDHTGLVPALASETSKVYISRGEISWMFGESRIKLWREDTEKHLRAGFCDEELAQLDKAVSRDMAADKTFERYLPIDDGMTFEYGGYKLQAVATPGHTPEHMCFWMEDQKTMFTGDHVLFDITPNITYWNECEDSLGNYLNSLKMIDKYDVKLALPGHRETGDFHKRVSDLLLHHEERLEECLQIVRKNPGLAIYQVAGLMSWQIRCNSWEDFPLGQKWFAVGECHSHLRHLEKRGLVKTNYDETILHFYAT